VKQRLSWLGIHIMEMPQADLLPPPYSVLYLRLETMSLRRFVLLLCHLGSASDAAAAAILQPAVMLKRM
jgi:hypothetical protein